MPTCECNLCTETVPITRYCIECSSGIKEFKLPPYKKSKEEGWDQSIEEKCHRSDDTNVSRHVLKSTHGKYDRPLAAYIFDDEQPIRILDSTSALIESHNGKSWKVKSGFRQTGHLLISDKRIFTVIPINSRAQIIPVYYEDITGIELGDGLLTDSIILRTRNRLTYKITVSGTSGTDLQNIVEKIENLKQQNSRDSRAVEFINKVDSVVAEAENAETVLHEVSELFKDRDDESRFDHAVAEANSLDELLASLSVPARLPEQVKKGSDTKKENKQSIINIPKIYDLKQRATYTAKNADPAEVGLYTIAGVFALKAAAVSAPFSTVLGLSAIAAGSAATGAYASTHPESLPARIDPIGLAMSAKSRGQTWGMSSAPGGPGTGATLGAANYILNEVAPSEYAHWYTNADIDDIMKGAELGAQHANAAPDISNPRGSAVLGSGLGLAYSYIDGSSQAEDLEELLDDDLYESMFEFGQGESDNSDVID